MSKEEFLKIQTCVLKVNIHCDGCKQKVKKILHKIDGVYTTTIDADQGKVTVSGNIDPATLIKKLAKSGKHAEPWPTKGGNNNPQLNNQLPKLQLESGKGGQKDNGKPQKGGGGAGGGGSNQKGQQVPPQQQLLPQQLQQQQMKGFKGLNLSQLKDLKIPFTKDKKSVKFDLPEEDGSDYDYSDEYDEDDDLDDLEGFDDDFDDDLKNIKIKPMNGPPNGNGMMNDKKAGGGGGGVNAKKGGGDVNGQSKGMVGGNEVKNSNGGKKGGNDGGNQNHGGGGGGGGSAGKNGGGGGKNIGGEPQDGKNGGNNKAATNGAKKGGGKSDAGGNPMSHPGMMGQGGVDPGKMGTIPAAAAVHGLPAGGPPGYFQGGQMAPEMIAAAHPYQQQQYLAAMMQQQRMMMNGQGAFQPMAYARPPQSVSYMPPQPEYTHLFSDENTSSCSIM